MDPEELMQQVVLSSFSGQDLFPKISFQQYLECVSRLWKQADEVSRRDMLSVAVFVYQASLEEDWDGGTQIVGDKVST